jgi:hypothetical protein
LNRNPGDDTISINGKPVNGTKIGGSTAFYGQNAGPVAGTEKFVTYRADITGLELVSDGSNTLTVSDMLFRSNFPSGFPFDQGNDGAGVLVIYDSGEREASTTVRDGLDLAFANFDPPLNATVPQTFSFPPSTSARTATLATFAGSVIGPDFPGPRANQLSITFDVGAPMVIDNPWQSNDGFEFDALNSSVTVPAGASQMTVQAVSGGPNGNPASIAWSAAALSVPPLAPAALGDFVWNDTNQNGIQDAGESGIADVTVRLLDCEGNVIDSTTTDANGYYLFSDLDPGSYSVEFVLPNGYVFSPRDQGADDAKDSDPNTTTGVTGCYTLAEGETNLTVDAGMYVPQPRAAGETATGFGTVYPNTSNWFMYTAYGTSKVDLVSGRDHKDAGDIYMSRSGSGSNSRTTIRIVLHTGWSWDRVDEVLKIQPFDRAPKDYLEPGAFLYKFTAPDLAKHPQTTVTFSGNSVTVTMPGNSPKFYGIHADVLRAL